MQRPLENWPFQIKSVEKKSNQLYLGKKEILHETITPLSKFQVSLQASPRFTFQRIYLL